MLEQFVTNLVKPSIKRRLAGYLLSLTGSMIRFGLASLISLLTWTWGINYWTRYILDIGIGIWFGYYYLIFNNLLIPYLAWFEFLVEYVELNCNELWFKYFLWITSLLIIVGCSLISISSRDIILLTIQILLINQGLSWIKHKIWNKIFLRFKIWWYPEVVIQRFAPIILEDMHPMRREESKPRPNLDMPTSNLIIDEEHLSPPIPRWEVREDYRV